jgi:hypothetical protein
MCPENPRAAGFNTGLVAIAGCPANWTAYGWFLFQSYSDPELVDQGFDPEATVADAGSGLRAGQALALPEVPCRGDIFHVLRDLEQVVGSLENRAYGAL